MKANLSIFIALAGAAMVVNATSTDDYVQAGLMAHWDVIDNAATGVHVASTNRWTDLKGGLQLSLNKYTWGDNYLYFDGTSSSGAILTDSTLFDFGENGGSRTVEIVVKFKDMMFYSTGVLFAGNGGSGILISRYYVAQQGKGGLTATVNAENMLGSVERCGQGLNTASFGYVKENDAVVRKLGNLRMNGIDLTDSSDFTSYPSAVTGNDIFIARDGNGNNRFNGYVYSVRVYNRLLTLKETRANQLVDAKRFRPNTIREFYVDAENGADDDGHDGTAPDKAKKTLVEIFKLANAPGDCVWALPGYYTNGTETVADESTSYTQTNRCVIPSGVTLKSTGGAAVTFIKGAKTANAPAGIGVDSIRGVLMKAEASLIGFTVSDSSVVVSAASGAGIRAYDRCYISDCVIRDCGADYGAVCLHPKNSDWAHRPIIIRSEVCNNTSILTYIASAIYGTCYAAINCHIHDNTYANFYPGGSTVYIGCDLSRLRNVNGCQLYGCYISGLIDHSSATSFYGCRFAMQSVYDSMLTSAAAVKDCSVGTAVVDEGDGDLYYEAVLKTIPELICDSQTDIRGNPRVSNRFLDFGPEEFDWRPVFANDLAAQRVTVTAATPGVYETDDKKVALTDGEELEVVWTAPVAGMNDYNFTASVTGEGTLGCYLNGSATPFETVTAADGAKNIEFSADGNPALHFAFTGAGTAKLDGFQDTISVTITIPSGGVETVGITPGETVVSPGDPLTFTLRRTYETDRLCTGFLVNGSTFVDFDDYANGWTHTVSNRATAVTVVAQYRTVQDFYVDPVKGNDANCGFLTNLAWKTLATISTNGNVRSGDTIYALPGTYAEGALAATVGAVTLSRVILPAGVRLHAYSPEGAKVTVIEGAAAPEGDADGLGDGAVRCVCMHDGSELKGFTLTGGRTTTGSDGNGYHAAIDNDYAAGRSYYVIDCVLTNNTASWRCCGSYTRWVRCRFVKNKGLNYDAGLYQDYLYNCVAKGNTGAYFVHMPIAVYNSTLLGSNVLRGYNDTQYYVYNSIVENVVNGCRLYNCRYVTKSASTYADEYTLQVSNLADFRLDDEGRAKGNCVRNVGDMAYLVAIPEAYRDTDIGGGPRVLNGRVDIGAYEYLLVGSTFFLH